MAIVSKAPTFTYQLLARGGVERSDGAVIPTDPKNKDYAAYLKWVAAGNTATPAAVPPPPVFLSPEEFLNRFTPAEQLAVQTVCLGSPTLFLGLIQGLSSRNINLTDATVATWMDGLVKAKAITQARSAVILTP